MVVRGTVIICRIAGSWKDHLAVVLECKDDSIRVLAGVQIVELHPGDILDVIGITPSSIDLANNAGRWML